MNELMGPAIISGVIALVGWLVKKSLQGAFTLLIEYIKNLLKQLSETTTKVSHLDVRMGELTNAMADVNKLKVDLNLYYARLKNLEEKFDNHRHD